MEGRDPAYLRAAGVPWLAMAACPLIYWGVLYYLINYENFQPVGMAPEPFKYISLALYGVSLVLAVASHRVYDSATRAVTSRREDPRSMVPRLLIAWSLADAIAIFGLVLAFIKADINLYYPLGIASLIIIVHERPALLW